MRAKASARCVSQQFRRWMPGRGGVGTRTCQRQRQRLSVARGQQTPAAV